MPTVPKWLTISGDFFACFAPTKQNKFLRKNSQGRKNACANLYFYVICKVSGVILPKSVLEIGNSLCFCLPWKKDFPVQSAEHYAQVWNIPICPDAHF